MDSALEELGRYGWLAFTSPAGVEACGPAWRRWGGTPAPWPGCSLAAIGPGTGRPWPGGLRADLVPEVYDAAHLGAGLAERAGEGAPPPGPGGLPRPHRRPWTAAGWPVTTSPVYDTRYENP